MSRAGRRFAVAFVLAVALASAASAQPAPPLTREQALADIIRPDVEARRRAAAWLGDVGTMADAPVLVQALHDADEVVRALAEHSIWQVWSHSGDPEVDSLLQIGIEQMNRGAGAAAVETFTRVIERRPDFAEGWNKRATVYFLMGDYQRSLHDCDEVLRRNPSHFGALAGYGQISLRLDQPERALQYFQRALDINPNMQGVAMVVDQLERLVIERRKDTI